MEKVRIYDSYVEKKFWDIRKYENELKYRNQFKDNFIVPDILSEDKDNLILIIDKVKGPFLEKELKKWNIFDVERLFKKLPLKKGRIDESSKIEYIKNNLKDIPSYVLYSVKGNEGLLVHGDFRPQNIFIKDDKFGLIDFENSGYSYPERDFSYFYMETIYFNKKLSSELLSKSKESKNYNRFLFYCLFYTLSSLENKFSNKNGLKSVLKEILEEIKKVT